MHIEEFPLCCKVNVLCGFPQSPDGDDECEVTETPWGESFIKKYRGDLNALPASVIKDYVKTAMKASANEDDAAFLVAALTSDQKRADMVLTELGFSKSGWASKGPYWGKSSEKIQLYWKPLARHRKRK